MRKQIEMLEHHADILADLLDVGLRGRDILSFNEHLAAGWPLQQVHAPQDRGFTGTGRTDQGDNLALFNL